MNDLSIFRYDGADLYTVLVDGEPWFKVADVCNVLEIGNPSMAAARLDDDEVTLISIEGRPQTNYVSEAGLFALILGSRKPEAKAFKRWVTHEVLPAIRKTGTYVAPASDLDQIKALHAAVGTLLEQNEKITARAVEAESFKAAIESNDGLTPREFHKHYLSDMPERAFFEVLYSSGLLIDQRGQRYDANGRPKPGKQHGHPSFSGKAFFYLHATVNRDGDRFENTRVRSGEAELKLADWFARRGHPVNPSVMAVAS